MPEQEAKRAFGPRPFWSGTITFGLVSLPVSLYTATRGKRVRLRMVDGHGEPLTRRYFCPKEERPLEAGELVRGYEVEKNQFVVVDDEELEAIAPEKSQEIDLRRFVERDEIDPMYFERAYFLAPEDNTIKPYRLLAKSMEKSGRAGIATCVMRGKEYLVAILADNGILRAETLRFDEELRSPADIGLEPPPKADKKTLHRMEKAINARARQTLDHKALADHQAQRVLDHVNEKLKAGQDVVMPETGADEPAGDAGEPADIMSVLKQSLEQRESDGKSGRKKAKKGK